MFNSYEIKKENGNEILFLYIDIDNEFSNIRFSDLSDNIKASIKKFIKSNNILFTGTLVTIIAGGTIVGNVILNNEDSSQVTDNSIAISENIDKINASNTILDNESIFFEESEDKLEERVPEVKNEIQSVIESRVETNNTNQTIQNIVQESEINKPAEVNTQVEEINTTSDTYFEEEIDNNIYVNVKRRDGSIINIELEEYLIGCVGAEMPAAFNLEALKAQSVIARTYALKSLQGGKILTDNESTQSYKTNDELMEMWGSSYNTYYNKIKNAVEETRGEYLSYNGVYIEAVYHSTSNGQTESSYNVWGNYYPYLMSVSSEFDSDNPTYMQDKFVSYDELSSKLNMSISVDTSFEILSKTSSERVSEINVDDKVFSGNDFRNKLSLRSADFDISKSDNGITFTTRGYGHGVGMSQYGANGMAKRGYNYTQILMHYYPNTLISNL